MNAKTPCQWTKRCFFYLLTMRSYLMSDTTHKEGFDYEQYNNTTD